MRSVKPMQTAKIGYFIMSAVFCAVGILLILFPSDVGVQPVPDARRPF